jgi:hypothetical protein
MAIDFTKMKVPADKKIKVKPVLSKILIGKPSKTSFFQVRGGEGFEPFELFTYVPEKAGVDNNPYLVQNEECQAYLEQLEVLIPAKFYLYMVYGSNIMKIDFISQKTDSLGNINHYHSSRMEAYEAAKDKWVRMYANQEGGFYSYAYAEDNLPGPDWPKEPINLEDALNKAFKDYIIDSLDHPIIKKLKGKL